MNEKQLLTLDEASARLGVCWQTTRRWAAAGVLASIRLGRRRMIPLAEVERLLREGTSPAHEAH